MSTKQHLPKLVRMRAMVRTAVILLLSFLMAMTLAVLPANAASANAIAERQAIRKLRPASAGTKPGHPATAGPPPAASVQAGGKAVTAPVTPVASTAAPGGASTVSSGQPEPKAT